MRLMQIAEHEGTVPEEESKIKEEHVGFGP